MCRDILGLPCSTMRLDFQRSGILNSFYQVNITMQDPHLSSLTSFQDLRPDDSVVQNDDDSSRYPGSTVGLSPTQLNSTRLSGSGAGPLS